jgi:Sporulation protein Cse60
MTTGSNEDLDRAVNEFLKTLSETYVRDIQYRESPGSMNNMASSSVMVVYVTEDSSENKGKVE